MKALITIFALLITVNIMSQDDSEPKYEMKTYYFVFLNAVPNKPDIDSARTMEIQARHMANIN